MANLALSRPPGFGGKDDYDVLEDGRVIGRIMKRPQNQPERPWFWTITDANFPRSLDNRGYSPTREDAIADFKARWSVA